MNRYHHQSITIAASRSGLANKLILRLRIRLCCALPRNIDLLQPPRATYRCRTGVINPENLIKLNKKTKFGETVPVATFLRQPALELRRKGRGPCRTKGCEGLPPSLSSLFQCCYSKPQLAMTAASFECGPPSTSWSDLGVTRGKDPQAMDVIFC
jgi:hypothetical protein